jgi:hypothetical protein
MHSGPSNVIYITFGDFTPLRDFLQAISGAYRRNETAADRPRQPQNVKLYTKAAAKANPPAMSAAADEGGGKARS